MNECLNGGITVTVQASTGAERFFGTVATVSGDFGFIGLGSVMQANGMPNGIPTKQDVFVHQTDCKPQLRVGLTLGFHLMPDTRRGEGCYKAVQAMECVEGELLSSTGETVPDFAVARRTPGVNASLVLKQDRLPIHARMKVVPKETIHKVCGNQPMPETPRDIPAATSEEEKIQLLMQFLAVFYPAMLQFGANFNVLTPDDTAFDDTINQTAEDLKMLGMNDQVESMRREAGQFKAMRSTLRVVFEEGLVRPDSIVPIRYLPDLFMAAPVWYHWIGNPDASREATQSWDAENTDPRPHPSVQYFCNLFPGNFRWIDTFQMFNRRARTLAMYKGDQIPPHIAKRIRRATDAFDYVVVATPYLDVAGKEWVNPEWIRSIDPYVLGFKKDVPYFFILARFSDTGTFPLFEELVADTMEFLKSNGGRLANLDNASSPYWYDGKSSEACFESPSSIRPRLNPRLGSHLVQHVQEMLKSFEAGYLFDWLRQEEKVGNKQPVTVN